MAFSLRPSTRFQLSKRHPHIVGHPVSTMDAGSKQVVSSCESSSKWTNSNDFDIVHDDAMAAEYQIRSRIL